MREFRVPRHTGSIGDTLIAWGLARLLVDLSKSRDVFLVSRPSDYLITAPLPDDSSLVLPAGAPSRLKWFYIEAKKPEEKPKNYNTKPTDIAVEIVDWGKLKEDRKRLRKVTFDQPADEWATSTQDLTHCDHYAYIPLPGTQIIGYDTLVHNVTRLIDGGQLPLLLSMYDSAKPLKRAEILQQLLHHFDAKILWANQHGFLFPGQNKGPTMRVIETSVPATGPGGKLRTVVIGRESKKEGQSLPDWAMVDWENVTTFEMYLAYVGFFHAARPLQVPEGKSAIRVVAVPEPDRVRATRFFDFLRNIRIPDSPSLDYLSASASLAYAERVLDYLTQTLGAQVRDQSTAVLQGVYLVHFWSPSGGTTFAPDRFTMAPIPSWLKVIAERFELAGAVEVIARHKAQLNALWSDQYNARLPQRERKLSERRKTNNGHVAAVQQAMASYARSLDGDIKAWFETVCAWGEVSRSKEIDLWPEEEIMMIVKAMEPEPRLVEIVTSDAFRAVAEAIRIATVDTYRLRREGRSTPFKYEGDLFTRLKSAAQRNRNDFARELHYFLSDYQEEAERRRPERQENEESRRRPAYPRRRIPEGFLTQWAIWLQRDDYETIAAALLAYGTSARGGQIPDAVSESDADETEGVAIALEEDDDNGYELEDEE